jgi:hypothetical protein
MSAEWIYAGLLFILSLVFDLVPVVKEWWEEQPTHIKRLGWLIGSFGLPLLLWVLNCYAAIELFGFTYVCDKDGLIQILKLGFAAYGLSQGGHSLAKLSGRTF